MAILLKTEKFEQASTLMSHQYYVAGRSDHRKDVMVGYHVFQAYLRSFERRNKRLQLRRLSLHADFLAQRSKVSGLEFRYLMQADFVLFIRTEINADDSYSRWFPVTLVYVGDFHSPFEIFARSVSTKYFDRVKCILNISQRGDLKDLMETYQTDRQRLPRWEFDSFSPSVLLGYDQLATKV